MIDHRQNEIVIVDSLKAYLTTQQRPCEVIRQNQVTNVPAYPYVSYSVTTPASQHTGMYSEAEDKTLYMDVLQTWSFTVQSDDQDEAFTLAHKIRDFFSAAGVTHLADHKISVRKVGGINTRDNLLSIEYEYRKGLDITFGVLDCISPDAQPYRGEVATMRF